MRPLDKKVEKGEITRNERSQVYNKEIYNNAEMQKLYAELQNEYQREFAAKIAVLRALGLKDWKMYSAYNGHYGAGYMWRKNGKVGETYHISTNSPISIRNLVDRICNFSNISFNEVVKISDERLK